ncbi:hypothetical protein T01_11262 [Trichinella spiralis]|uniref:Uncharacterized protein n=1 Tax=Trichinella spiralis TaxID=6334 RepID=A0A0V1AMZ3_TRISP|nr:hypothetical protein T01_11262 [Trichinella spiralis]
MVADGNISIQVAQPDDILTIDAENTFAFMIRNDIPKFVSQVHQFPSFTGDLPKVSLS